MIELVFSKYWASFLHFEMWWYCIHSLSQLSMILLQEIGFEPVKNIISSRSTNFGKSLNHLSYCFERNFSPRSSNGLYLNNYLSRASNSSWRKHGIRQCELLLCKNQFFQFLTHKLISQFNGTMNSFNWPRNFCNKMRMIGTMSSKLTKFSFKSRHYYFKPLYFSILHHKTSIFK